MLTTDWNGIDPVELVEVDKAKLSGGGHCRGDGVEAIL